MRIVSFREAGAAKVGLVKDGRLAALPPRWDNLDFGDMLANDGLGAALSGLAARPDSFDRALDDVSLTVPLARQIKIVCLGLNYAEHALEGGHAVPEYPSLFLRTVTSLVPPGVPMLLPFASSKFDYEAELMVVIGKAARHVKAENALDHVFGYSCFNDGSLRDFQRRTAQWTAGKNFDRTGAVGPWIVTRDELPPGAAGLAIECRLNGVVMQQSNTSNMLVSVAKAIEIISEIVTLNPGDMIAMGTPQGVGHARQPQVWMKAGDVVEVEIEGIGTLRSEIEAELPAGAWAGRPAGDETAGVAGR